MRKSFIILLILYVTLVVGFGFYFIVYPMLTAKVCTNTPGSKCSVEPVVINKPTSIANLQLELTDFDILVVTDETPAKIFHLNYIDNKKEDYAQFQVAYTLDGVNLEFQMVPISALKWDQLQSNNSEYSLSANFSIADVPVVISVPSVYLDMVVRAQPEVGKYAGATPAATANVTIAGDYIPAYVGMTAGFFNKFTPVDLKAMGVKTNWLLFFDKDWNFYHLDVTSVEKPSQDYYSHAFFAQNVASTRLVQYAKDISVTKSANSLQLTAKMADIPIVNTYELKDAVVPYSGAKLQLIEGAYEVKGIYTFLDSSLLY
jgi:hypothetical protein